MKCLFVFGLTKAERAQVGDDVRTFRRAKHPALLALQDVISEPEVGGQVGQQREVSLSFGAHRTHTINSLVLYVQPSAPRRAARFFSFPAFCMLWKFLGDPIER